MEAFNMNASRHTSQNTTTFKPQTPTQLRLESTLCTFRGRTEGC